MSKKKQTKGSVDSITPRGSVFLHLFNLPLKIDDCGNLLRFCTSLSLQFLEQVYKIAVYFSGPLTSPADIRTDFPSEAVLLSSKYSDCSYCNLSQQKSNGKCIISYIVLMHRKTLPLFGRDCRPKSSHLQNCNNLVSQQPHLESLNNKLTLKSKLLPNDPLSTLNSYSKGSLHTVFSSRLFQKAHRVQPSSRQTYLPLSSQIVQCNEEKIKNVYEAYLKITARDKSTSTQTTQKKRFSVSSRNHNSQDKVLLVENANKPFISSLTKIVMDQCYLPLPQIQKHLESSVWNDILCDIQQAQSHSRDSPKCRANPAENPYELLPIRKRACRKQNRWMVVQKIQKKRERS